MDQQEQSRYENQSQKLRAELKTWETTFAKTHEGKKPSRSDIKAAPEIAQKYKEYNRIRDILSGKIVPAAAATTTEQQAQKQKPQFPTPRKRKSTDTLSLYDQTTPSKRTRPISTPLKRTATHSSALTTPSTARKLFGTPGSSAVNVPTSIGPTPQRDGRVLGLFDLLTASPAETRTPSKRTGAIPVATPRRGGATINAADPGSSLSAARLARTPVSSGRRHVLDGFMTPLGRRDGNSSTAAAAANAGLDRTPSKTPSKPDFATPQFLRRLPPPAPAPTRLDENGEAVPAVEDDDYDYEAEEARRYAARLPRKPLVRGLSSVVASLRKMEEEKHDDDLDALREMEAEELGFAQVKTKAKPAVTAMETGNRDGGVAEENVTREVLVADSQVMPTNLLGGFDDEAIYDSPDEDDRRAGLDRNGQPLRVFKKKGQKRTTRRANMRPVRSRRPASISVAAEDSASDEDGDDVVPETQHQLDCPVPEDADELSLASESEFDDEEGEDDAGRKQRRGKKGRGKAKAKKAGPGKEDQDGKEGGTVKRAIKKVSAVAHQNFRRLKLRNNGAKGGPGFNSKFRRRR
ncbi:hypothetical protein PpBr36_08251 [Pyricularia pennisetigena]|uniref:hypothetical protein n=1 Tax=Pyricularia pennisetigena TaxID=1578925 RepID=UPI00114FC736|nr:hypothetical protein PpBr36_08251 [Pyricularia pennisetigena]TLS24532.1 hypothetical protein PpBr36_08251 [Pyricularia pennisetigena]